MATMTRGQLWAEVRPRLVVLGAVALVVGGGWLAMGRSVHFGPPPRYLPPDSFDGQVTTWQAGFPGLLGWVDSYSSSECPSLVVWTTNMGRTGYASLGPVGPHAHHRLWAGQLQDIHHVPVLAWTKPKDLTFVCYWSDSS